MPEAAECGGLLGGVASDGAEASGARATGPEPAKAASGPAAAGGTGAGTVRRQPVQRRSVERFERLLDACAALLDEVGYEALTTSQVARRAGVPIGTLYQFFDGKPALARALARRNLDAFAARLGRRFAAAPVTSWPDAGSAVVAEFVAMKREVPGFAVVDFGEAAPGRDFLLDPDRELENNQIVAQRLKRFALDDLGLPDGPGLDAVLLVAVEAADGVLRLAFRYGPAGDPDLIAEADALVRGYLAMRLPESASEPE
jgi:AcrR family transcriptional regulator